MGPTWVLSAPDGPYVGPTNLATRDIFQRWFYDCRSPVKASGGYEQMNYINLQITILYHNQTKTNKKHNKNKQKQFHGINCRPIYLICGYNGETITLLHPYKYTLQWRHVSVMASQITGISTICLTAFSGSKWYQNFALLVLCEGNSPFTGGFSSQRTSNRESDSKSLRQHSRHLLHRTLYFVCLFFAGAPRNLQGQY